MSDMICLSFPKYLSYHSPSANMPWSTAGTGHIRLVSPWSKAFGVTHVRSAMPNQMQVRAKISASSHRNQSSARARSCSHAGPPLWKWLASDAIFHTLTEHRPGRAHGAGCHVHTRQAGCLGPGRGIAVKEWFQSTMLAPTHPLPSPPSPPPDTDTLMHVQLYTNSSSPAGHPMCLLPLLLGIYHFMLSHTKCCSSVQARVNQLLAVESVRVNESTDPHSFSRSQPLAQGGGAASSCYLGHPCLLRAGAVGASGRLVGGSVAWEERSHRLAQRPETGVRSPVQGLPTLAS